MAGIYSLYNQSPEPLIDDYGFKLPLFHHISFIELLYNEAINEHYDFSLLSNRYSNMQSIFSTIIERIIENIDVGSYETCSDKEYPLGYHFLISKIFGVIGHWLYTFCDDENYDKENSLTVFIPFCFSLSVNSLFKGLKNNKISLDFIKRLYRYHLFETYFSNKLKPEIEKEINERCIKEIPNEHLQSILEFSLDEILAVSYYSFISPSTENDSCNRQQQSLHKFLKENSMI